MSIFDVLRLLEQAMEAIDDVPWEQEFQRHALQRAYQLAEKAKDGLEDLMRRRAEDNKEGA